MIKNLLTSDLESADGRSSNSKFLICESPTEFNTYLFKSVKYENSDADPVFHGAKILCCDGGRFILEEAETQTFGNHVELREHLKRYGRPLLARKCK